MTVKQITLVTFLKKNEVPPQNLWVNRQEFYHGDTEAQASPERFAEASTEKQRLLEFGSACIELIMELGVI